MDIQTLIDNSMAAMRADTMKNSEQLTLGELILKLETMPKEAPVFFDDKQYRPTGLGSWRGAYCELAIQYSDGGDSCYSQPEPTCQKDDFGDHDYSCPCGGLKRHPTTLPSNPTVANLIDVLTLAKGKIFTGYKGGDFTMGKTTPVWVANCGTSSGYKESEGLDPQAVIDVRKDGDDVIIETKNIAY